MKTSFSALALVAAFLSSSANAHVQLKSPLPYRSTTAAPQNAGSQDFDMKAPLAPSGANFPCKGYHKDKQGTQSLVEWAAGSTQVMKFDGSATHGGGSCQASLSEDGGTSFKVIKSYIGGCPIKDASFTVPKDAKAGAAIFSWTWFNQQGNREMYMNCAAVTITGGGSGLSTYPDMFTANIGKDCTTAPGDLAFPNPGQSVEGSGGLPPVGSACGAAGSQPPAGSSPSSGSTIPGGPGGSKPNPSPTTSNVPQVTPPAPSSSSPAPTSSPAPSGTKVPPPAGGQPPSPTSSSPVPTSSPAPSGTKVPPPAGAQPPSPTTNSPAASGTGAPAPSYPAPSPSTPPSPSSKPSTGGACVEGAITCNPDGTWSQCGSGSNQNMGKPAPGTVCENGSMKAGKSKRSIRFSGEHMARNA